MAPGWSDRVKSALLSWSEEDYLQIVIVQRVAVEHADGFIRFALCAHGYEGKAIGLPAFAILDNIDGCNVSHS